MRAITKPRVSSATLEPKAKLFRGLGDSSRLAILEALRTGERSVGELVSDTGLSQPNVSSHLACLKDCGLVVNRSEGRFVYYRIAGRDVAKMLDYSDATLELLAARIAACVNYGR